MAVLPKLSTSPQSHLTRYNPDGSFRTLSEAQESFPSDTAKVLAFEFGTEADIPEEYTWSSFLAGDTRRDSPGAGSNIAIGATRDFLEDPFTRRPPDEQSWSFQDPLNKYHKSSIAGNKVYLHRDYSQGVLHVVVKTTHATVEDARLNETGIITTGIITAFNQYEKACNFWTPSIYDENSRLVTLINEMATRDGDRLTSAGLESESEGAFFGETDPQTYDFSAIGLTDENITDPKKIIEMATEAGILYKYSFSDYTNAEGHKQFASEVEYYPARGYIMAYYTIDADYLEAVPTRKMIKDSWVESGEGTDFINLATDDQYESATEQYAAGKLYYEYLQSEEGRLVACMFAGNTTSWLPPAEEAACKSELEQLQEEVDRFGFGALFQENEDGEWSPDVEALRRRYPNISRNTDHLRERYGTFAMALTDPGVAGEVSQRIGRKILQNEARAIHESITSAALNRRMNEDFKAASNAKAMSKVAEHQSRTRAPLKIDIAKFMGQIESISEAFRQFDSQLADFKSKGGYLKTEDLSTVPRATKKEAVLALTAPGAWNVYERKNPNTSNARKMKVRAFSLPVSNEVPKSLYTKMYSKNLSFSAEADNLDMLAKRLKKFVVRNLKFLKTILLAPDGTYSFGDSHNAASESLMNILKHPEAMWGMGNFLGGPTFGAEADMDAFGSSFFGGGDGIDGTTTMQVWLGAPLTANQTTRYDLLIPSHSSSMSTTANSPLFFNAHKLSAKDINDVVSNLHQDALSLSDRQVSPINISYAGKDGTTYYINLGLPGESAAAGETLGDIVKAFSNFDHATSFLRYMHEIDQEIVQYQTCKDNTGISSAGYASIAGVGAGSVGLTPAGLALTISAKYLFPEPDPKGFQSAVKGTAAGTYVNPGPGATTLSPGNKTGLTVAKALKSDFENAMKAIDDDYNKALKEQIDSIKGMLPPYDKRCFDWDYIKNVVMSALNWRNILCKVFECLGIPFPPLPIKFGWPGWPDLWPPKFPWPPKNPLGDLWELIKMIILSILCSIISMILDFFRVDCDLYNMVAEEVLEAIPGADEWIAEQIAAVRSNPYLQSLVEVFTGPLGNPSDLEMQNMLREELQLDACDDNTPEVTSARRPLTRHDGNRMEIDETEERYNPLPDVSLLIKDLQALLTPAEFIELLSGKTTIDVKSIVGVTAESKYSRLYMGLGNSESRMCEVIRNIGEISFGKQICLALAAAPDMATPPSEVCYNTPLREKLLSKSISGQDLERHLDREHEKRNDFMQKILKSQASPHGNMLLGELGVNTPTELVGGTMNTVNNPQNPVIVPFYSQYEMDYQKSMVRSAFRSIEKSYNSDIDTFLDYLTDDTPPPAPDIPTDSTSYFDKYPPNEVSERDESMLFKQMMDNPYSGLYRTYEQVIEELGEDPARAIRHLHFFRPRDPSDLIELDSDIKQARMTSMFLAWQKSQFQGRSLESGEQQREIAKRLKAVLTNSSLISSVKEADGNFYVVLEFPNITERRDPEVIDSELKSVNTGGSMVYDSTPGKYCSTDFKHVEDSYKISFNGPFFTGAKNNNKISTFERDSKIEIEAGSSLYKYFTEKMGILNNEPLQPTAFAELLRMNTSNWSWVKQKYVNQNAVDNHFRDRDGLFFNTALEAYNEMEQYIFESMGRFISGSLVLNPLSGEDVFPRGSRGIIASIDEGRAGLELLAENINPLFTDTDPPCRIPGLMDWESVREKVITQLNSLLTKQLGDEPSWPTPYQYSIATAGFLNSWIRLEIVQIVLEGLVSFYEFGLSILDEEVMISYIRTRVEARNRKQGRAFRMLFERLASEVLKDPNSSSTQSEPDKKKGFDRFQIPFSALGEPEPFEYKLLDGLIKTNIGSLKSKIAKIISAPENIYDGLYSTFPSLDLFKNDKILYDLNSDMPSPEGETHRPFPADPEGAVLVKQEDVLYSRSGSAAGGYDPIAENQICNPTTTTRGKISIKDDISEFIGQGTFAFQKYIRFVPNTLVGQTEEALFKALTRPGSATDPEKAAMGYSFLRENPYFYPNAIPLSDFQNFVEGLGGPPPEEEGDMTWWAEHFASELPDTPRELYGEGEEDEIPYPENTYINTFSADSSRKLMAESILARLVKPPSTSRSQNYGRVPGVARNSRSPEGSTDLSIRRGADGNWTAEGPLKVVKNAEGWWVYEDYSPVIDTPYFTVDNSQGAAGSNYKSRFMNPVKWNGPVGRNELQINLELGSVYGNYIQDEIIARTSSGVFPTNSTAGAFSSSVIDQTRPSGRMFLDYWQLPESISEIDDYNLDYENLWIPARFEVIDYKYKENPRFIHGSTDLFKDKEGVLQTLSEIKSSLESVKYLDGPWDALHQAYRDTSSIHYGYGYKYHSKYTKRTMLDEYFTAHFTRLGKFGQPIRASHQAYTSIPLNGGVAETQTWKDCIDRALVMIANWPDLHNAPDEVFENLEISNTSYNGAQLYDKHINPYPMNGHQGKEAIRIDGRRWEDVSHDRVIYSIWWWDLACLIANEHDNPNVFTECESGPRSGQNVSKLSDMLSFSDQFGRWRQTKSAWADIRGNTPSTWEEWREASMSFLKDVPNDDGGFQQRFYYGSVFASSHRQGHTTTSNKTWDVPIKRRVGPDIIPPIVQKRRDRHKSRVGEMACYGDMVKKSGHFGRDKIERMVEEAKILLEARDKYNLSVDPSTLDARGKSLYGYYEKFLIQRLRLPDWNEEFKTYRWVHQRETRVYYQPRFLSAFDSVGGDEILRRSLLFGAPGISEGDFGFSYKKYNLPETSGDWVNFMKQVDEMIEYVKAQPSTSDVADKDTSITVNENAEDTNASVTKQYAVHFVNAKAVFSGVLRSPDGDNIANEEGITPRESRLPGFEIQTEGAYDSDGGLTVVKALMDPNHPAWGDTPTREKARLIRDNLKTVAHSGAKGLTWWRKLMDLWSFKGQVWWQTSYTTEMIGETKIETIDQSVEDHQFSAELPTLSSIGESSSNSHRASLHPVGGDEESSGFYLWSKGYKLSALKDWNRLEEQGRAWFSRQNTNLKSPNSFFFTWGDDDIQLDRNSSRAISKFLNKNKLAERILGIPFESEAMWYGDRTAPEDMLSTDGSFNSFTTTPDRPQDYWSHTKLTPLLENADFGRLAGLGSSVTRQSSRNGSGLSSQLSSFNVYANKLDTIKQLYSGDESLNVMIPGQEGGGISLNEIVNQIPSRVPDSPRLLVDGTRSIYDNSDNLQLDQLSVIDFWPDNCASDTNPYSWHREYVFYNALKKVNETREAQRANAGYAEFAQFESGNNFYNIQNVQQGMQNNNSVYLGVFRTRDDFYIEGDGQRSDIPAYQGFVNAPASMVNHFLPFSDPDELYIPSPFGVHPNLSLYRLKLEDDLPHAYSTARPNTPVAKRQAVYSPGRYVLDEDTSVYTATKTLVRKRTSFAIKRPINSVGTIGNWFYNLNTDSEGNIKDSELPPEKVEELKPALSYFETAGLDGKPVSTHLANSTSGADSQQKNINTLMNVCREIEAENLLSMTYVRMWQARKHYLQAYAKWAKEDVVKAFERLTTSIANCNMEYVSRMIYIPKTDEEDTPSFSGWDSALDADGTLSVENIGSCSRFKNFLNSKSTNLGLEVVSNSTDEEAVLGGKITASSRVVPIPYVPIVERGAALSIEDLVTIEKASASEIRALGFSEAFSEIISDSEEGLPLVKFLTKGDEFVDGAFTSSLLPSNQDADSPALTVQEYLIDEIKNSDESQMLFKYLFPLRRYASTYSIYTISATSSMYNMDNLFYDTREELVSLLKSSMDSNYKNFANDYEQNGIMPPDLMYHIINTRMSGFRTDQWGQIYKKIIEAPKGLAMMIMSMTDPFYFDAQKKLKSCDLRRGMNPKSFAVPFRDNNKGHQLKPFTLYPPLPFIPPLIYGPMGLLYDYNLDTMASPLGPALLGVGPLMGDTPKAICNYRDGDPAPSALSFGPLASSKFVGRNCDDED